MTWRKIDEKYKLLGLTVDLQDGEERRFPFHRGLIKSVEFRRGRPVIKLTKCRRYRGRRGWVKSREWEDQEFPFRFPFALSPWVTTNQERIEVMGLNGLAFVIYTRKAQVPRRPTSTAVQLKDVLAATKR